MRERLAQLWERTGDDGLGRIVAGRSLLEAPDAPTLAELTDQECADWVSTALMQCFKRSGDPQVFALLFELNESSFAHAIHARLRRTVSNVDERDVLQEVFLNIYRYPHRFLAEKADSFRNWGHRIVQNTLLKFLKLETRRRKVTQLQEDLGERPDVRARTPLRFAENAEQQRTIDRAFLIYLNLYLLHFRQLSAKEQRALTLVEVDGASYRDTAARLGVRLENLKMVVFRARRKIFRAMSRSMAEVQVRAERRFEHGASRSSPSRAVGCREAAPVIRARPVIEDRVAAVRDAARNGPAVAGVDTSRFDRRLEFPSSARPAAATAPKLSPSTPTPSTSSPSVSP